MQVGKRYKCVDASIKPEAVEWQRAFCPNWVKEGETYTVRQLTDHDGIVEGVLLEEIVNPVAYNMFMDRPLEPHFALWRFAETQESVAVEMTVETEFEKLAA